MLQPSDCCYIRYVLVSDNAWEELCQSLSESEVRELNELVGDLNEYVFDYDIERTYEYRLPLATKNTFISYMKTYFNLIRKCMSQPPLQLMSSIDNLLAQIK